MMTDQTTPVKQTDDDRRTLLACPWRERKFENLNHFTPKEDWDILRRLLAEYRPHTVVEVGCWTGATTMVCCEVAKTVFAVDHWQGSPMDDTGCWAAELGHDRVFQAFCGNLSDLLMRQVFPLKE